MVENASPTIVAAEAGPPPPDSPADGEEADIVQFAQLRNEGPVVSSDVLRPSGADRGEPIGTVQATNGDVIVSRVDQSNQVLQPGDPIYQGDIIATQAGGVQVSFNDGTIGHLGADARMLVQSFATGIGSSAPVLFVISGPFSFASPPGGNIAANALTVRTPVASVRLEGGRIVGRAAPEAVENRFTLLRNFDGTLGRAVIATASASYVLQSELASAQVVSLFRDPSPLPSQSFAQIEASLGGSIFDWIGVPAAGAEQQGSSVDNASAVFVAQFADPAATTVTPDGTDNLGAAAAGAASAGAAGDPLAAGGDRGFFVDPSSNNQEPVFGGVTVPQELGQTVSVPFSGFGSGGGSGSNIELFGTAGIDTLVVTADPVNPNTVTISQLDGKVVLSDGVNTITLDDFEELQLNLGIGNDNITVNDLSQTDILNSTVRINLGAGDDYVDASNAGKRHIVTGDDGNDTMIGSDQSDELYGGSGDDYLDGGPGIDLLVGGPGDDTYIVDETGDIVVELPGEGIDSVRSTATFTLPANVENLVLLGTGDINGTGNELNNTITGNSGNNILDGGAGTDTMAGGAGNDTYVVDNVGDVVVENAGEGVDTVQSSVTYALSANVEHLTLTGSTNIDGTGNALDNTITGNSGNNILDGGAGADTMAGGAGNDTYIVDNAGDVVTENAGEGIDTVLSSVTYALSANVEHLTLTGSANIDGTGNELDNTLTGNSGNNILDGGAGADTMAGGAGNDTYIVDNVGDVVTENAGEGIDTVQSSVTYTLSANVEHLTLTGSANIDATGNELDNTITGNSGVNILTGGAGNDTYIVQNSADEVVENPGEGIDTVQSSVSYALSANVEHLTLTGSANIDGTGNELDNTITGNSGNNILDGGAGADTMAGGAGNDTYVVDNAGDVVIENAGEGIDTVLSSVTYTLSANVEHLTLTGTADINGTGNELANTITGNSGNNILNGGAGADTMAGGAGNDTYIVDNVGDVVTENAGEGIDTVQSSVTYTLSANVEHLTLTGSANINGTGNELNNTITGNSGNNILNGGAGADTMAGGAGNDTYIVDNVGDVVTENPGEGIDTVQSSVTYALSANVEHLTLTGTADIDGTGNELDNTITGNSGENTLTGGAGNDTYIVQNSADEVVENPGEGIDTVQSSVTYALSANVEHLTLTGSADINGTGNELDNTITGNSGVNVLTGGAGNDTYIVQNSADEVVENPGEGVDTVQSSVTYALSANVEHLTLTGSTNINGTGNELDNMITGNSGNNILDGGAGADTLIGGGGSNTVTYAASAGAVTVNLATNINTGGDAEGDTLTGIANLTGSSGNDSLTGNSGNNILDGGAGADTMAGGAGNDTYVVDNVGDDVIENPGEGVDTVLSSVTYALSANVEHLTLTGPADINGTGNELDNTITGNSGVNILTGGAGNDTYIVQNSADVVVENPGEGIDTVQSSVSYALSANVEHLTLTGSAHINGTGNELDNTITGNSGTNVLTGGAGNDTYIVQNSADVVVENPGEGIDTVQSSVSYALSANVEHLTLTGSANIDGTGNELDNTITGNSGNNILDGGAGADTMAGGAGNDTYIVDNVGDVVIENAGAGIDTVLSSVTYTLSANVEHLTLTGTADIDGTGNALNNTIIGNAGANTLAGGGGDNILFGGAGADILDAGGGDNDLYYSAPEEGGDTVHNFATGSDEFVFLQSAFANISTTISEGLNFATIGEAYDGSNGATSGAPGFIFDTASGILTFDADGNGGAAGFTIATLSSGTVTAGDIQIATTSPV